MVRVPVETSRSAAPLGNGVDAEAPRGWLRLLLLILGLFLLAVCLVGAMMLAHRLLA